MAINLLKTAFKKYPFVSNSITYGCMCVGAEFSQQVINKQFLHPTSPPEKFDINALKRYTVIGFGINPTILFFWYKWLDRNYVGVSRKVIIKKVLLDQFIMTPPLYVLFYTSMSLMEGKSDFLAECRAKFVTTFQTSCIFWLPAQTINFWLIPNTFRVAFVGSCSFAWLNILLWLKRKEVD